MSRVFCCAASAASNNSTLFSFVEENDDETAATLRADVTYSAMRVVLSDRFGTPPASPSLKEVIEEDVLTL